MENTAPMLFKTAGRPVQWRMNEAMHAMLQRSGQPDKEIAVVCIGSDRLIGDCYGPLTGFLLSKLKLSGLTVFGTLETPVHALTIEETLGRIDRNRTLVIAVDSSVGDATEIGSIAIAKGPLRPGSGLGKHLPTVGDLAVTGVTAADSSPFLNLQNAQLGMVYKMAECTAAAIEYAVFASRRAVKPAREYWSPSALPRFSGSPVR